MTTATEPKIEIVPAGERLAEDKRGKGTFTSHFDVVCPNCGPIASNVMYPTAARERAEHLCRPSRRRG